MKVIWKYNRGPVFLNHGVLASCLTVFGQARPAAKKLEATVREAKIRSELSDVAC